MSKVNLFCGINSLGMPFTRDNRNHIGYFDIIKKNLELSGFNVEGFNFSRFNKNRTWELMELLEQKISIKDIRNTQVHSIESLRNANLLFKLIIPPEFKEKFLSKGEKDDVNFKDIYIDSENPLFLYSAGANDFFTYIKAGPVELLDKKNRDNLPNNLGELVIKCVDNIEQNFQLLYELNKNVIIYAFSFYYSPLYDKIQKLINLQPKSNNRNKENKFRQLIELFNKTLEERCQKYDYVKYVDISFIENYCAAMDFHPNKQGNELIAQKIIDNLELENINSTINRHKL